MKQLSFKAFLSISVGALFILLFLSAAAMTLLYSYSDMKAINEQLRKQTADLLMQSVREPIIQGSFVEARSRINSAINAGSINCADITVNGSKIESCSTQNGDRPLEFEKRSLSFGNGSTEPLAIIEFKFNRVSFWSIVAQLSKLAIPVSIILAVFAVVIMLSALRLIKREIASIVETFDSVDETPHRFQLLEFQELSTSIGRLLKIAKTAAEEAAVNELAKQLAHDIRSPLSAMNLAADALRSADDERVVLIKKSVVMMNRSRLNRAV